jgi:ribosomal-protein-alanine N-acetyltransferase
MSDFMPILETERLILRPFKVEDAGDVFEYASDSETAKYMNFDAYTSIYDAINFIGGLQTKYENKKCLDYAFVLKETGKVIGGGRGVFDSEDSPHKVGIGYIINKKYWGNGYTVEGMKAIFDRLFNVLHIHRIEAYHFAENTTSGRVMQKLGMTYEGTQVDAVFLKGRYWTIKLYGIINPNEGSNYSQFNLK